MENGKRGGGDNTEAKFSIRTSSTPADAVNQLQTRIFPCLSSDVPQKIRALGNPRNSAAASQLSSLALGTNCCCTPGLVGESLRGRGKLAFKMEQKESSSPGEWEAA